MFSKIKMNKKINVYVSEDGNYKIYNSNYKNKKKPHTAALFKELKSFNLQLYLSSRPKLAWSLTAQCSFK